MPIDIFGNSSNISETRIDLSLFVQNLNWDQMNLTLKKTLT